MGLHLVSSNDEYDVEYTTMVTPRQEKLLVTVLSVLATEAYGDADEFGDRRITAMSGTRLLDRYPPATWGQDHQWRRRAARAFNDLADDLAQGRLPSPQTTAEEMALHVAINRAEALAADPATVAHVLDGLPEQPADRDWDGLRQDLFQDHDVLLLFEFDRIEDIPDIDGDYALIRPENWFVPFDDDTARDPDRGFQN